MSSPTRVLTFDIGIRNLAWCFLEKGTGTWSILGWENYDLLAGSSSEEAKQAAKVFCKTCGKRGTHEWRGEFFCRKHCTGATPLSDLSGNLLKKIPAVATLRALAGPAAKKFRKLELLEEIKKKFAIPIEPKKATKAIQTDLGALHSALQKFVDERRELFRTASRILLENQPAFKNPTMKSLQILLFATLRERVLPGDLTIGFVHAGKKTLGSEGGDSGYAQRKKASELRVEQWFQKETVAKKDSWKQFLQGNAKKNDLCDCLCMCLDASK